ncbi:MAG: V-type ATP synthase subunit D [Brevinematales bacterium]|nr:V-type ATP synthase subunit D [Brevinematales bacterium]
MNLAEIAPTKTNLLEYKDQLAFSIEGHDLLEEKREVLVMHLLEIAEDVKKKRELLNQKLKDMYYQFKLLKLEFGELGLRKILMDNYDKFDRLTITEKSIMGVNIPVVKQRKKDEKKLNFESLTSLERFRIYDRFSKKSKEFIDILIQVAELEARAWRLAYEIKKTQRRVNALENIFIPEFKEIIKFIQDTLEERERETFFQMKRVKEK